MPGDPAPETFQLRIASDQAVPWGDEAKVFSLASQANLAHLSGSRSFSLLVQGPAPPSPQVSPHPCAVLLIGLLLLTGS